MSDTVNLNQVKTVVNGRFPVAENWDVKSDNFSFVKNGNVVTLFIPILKNENDDPAPFVCAIIPESLGIRPTQEDVPLVGWDDTNGVAVRFIVTMTGEVQIYSSNPLYEAEFSLSASYIINALI